MSYDAIIVGGGHNGLVAATKIAKAGKNVALVEANDTLGGLAARRKFGDFSVPGVLHDSDCVRAGVISSLGLGQYGLTLDKSDIPVLAAEPGGPGILLYREPKRAQSELSKLSEEDAKAYTEWRAFFGRVRGFVGGVLNAPPPSILSPKGAGDFWDLGKRGLALRRLGKADMTELLRVSPMAVADFVRESFANPRLCALIAAPAVIGHFAGPHSAGTTANLLMHEVTAETAGIKGGSGNLIDALEKAAKAAGVAIKTGSAVAQILVESGKVRGVKLADGTTLEAPKVGASVNPKHVFLDLLHPTAVPINIEDQFRVIRTRGTTAKVHLGLRSKLIFEGRADEDISRARTGGELDDIERAFDAVKYGEFSAKPHLDIRTYSGDGVAPAGQQVVSIVVSYAPYDLDAGWSEATKTALFDAVIDVLAEVAPGVRDQIVAHEVLTPVDLETEYGLTGGQIHHGEPGLDQLLFMRPAPCAANYRTPIGGLFLCGAGCHPGGGITCAPGSLGAAAMLGG